MSNPFNSAELSPLSFERLAVLAVSSTTRVELCRVVMSGEHHGAFAAVKRLPPELSEDPALRSMFRDEIWMATALQHPNVAQVLGWGEDEAGLFLASEFVRGVSLSRLMRTVFRTGEAFTERLIVFLAGKVCAGLEAAHDVRSPQGSRLNLVHRDLTPGNILLSFDGHVKITDFGLAKAEQRITRTAVGITKGKPAYMSPEQVCGKPLDGRSDLFALGVVLFELLTQRRPWTVKTIDDALTYIVNGDTPDLSALCPRVDSSLVQFVTKCLARDPEQRFQSANELRLELDEWLMLHGYQDSEAPLGRFVRRNALRQMRWIDRALAGGVAEDAPSPLEVSRDESAVPESAPVAEGSRPIELHAPAASPEVVEVTEATTKHRMFRHAAPNPPSSSDRGQAAASPHAAPEDGRVALPAQSGPVTMPLDKEQRTSTGSDAASHEPSTLRRASVDAELHEYARRVAHAASALADQVRAAAEDARGAASAAEAAAHHAKWTADRAEQVAEAARLAADAVQLSVSGDQGRAIEVAQQAHRLHQAAMADEGK